MQLEVITIGDELCRGEIVNTNAAWMAAALWEMQMTVGHLITCGDLPADIITTVTNAAQRSDVVLVCGGLGPTVDDCTVDSLCQLVGSEAVIHEPSATRMKERFAQIGIPLLNTVMRQVRHPQGSLPFLNPVGVAPGFEVSLPDCAVICLPGPPREMKAIFNAHVRERLSEIRSAKGEAAPHIASVVLRVFGKSETEVATALEDLRLEEGSSLHYQVSFPELFVKLVAYGKSTALVQTQIQSLKEAVKKRLGTSLYGEGKQGLAQVVGQLLADREQTIATAESCTGGGIGALLTDAAGASEFFLGGAVTYSNAEKVRQLGVSETTLEMHGAVSEEVVIAMATGICERSGSSWGLAVSGIAGPGGGTEEKPVGTVWIAVVQPDGKCVTKKYSWPGTRERVRTLTAFWALDAVRRLLLENEEGK